MPGRLGQRLVVTSRTDEYRATAIPIAGPEIRLTGAAGIELSPLTPAAVAEYLEKSSGGVRSAARWKSVTSDLISAPNSLLARVLTIPLMVSLARLVYNPLPGRAARTWWPDPSELLDQRRFPNEKEIQDHLYDCFIEASYNPDLEHPSAKHRWSAKKAKRWLQFIAKNLESRPSTEISWWRLPDAVPAYSIGLILAFTLGIVAGIGYPFIGFGIGVLTGLLVGLLARRRLPVGSDGIARGLMGGLLGGAVVGPLALPILGPAATHGQVASVLSAGLGIGIAVSPVSRFYPGLIAGFVGTTIVVFYEHAAAFRTVRDLVGVGSHVINGIGVGLAVYLMVRIAARQKPARGLHWSPIWFSCTVGSGSLLGIAVWIGVGRLAGLVTGISAAIGGVVIGWLGDAVNFDPLQESDPAAVLKRDRSTFLASWFGIGSALGIATGIGAAFGPTPNGQPGGFKLGFAVGLTNLIVVGIGFALSQACWGQFAIARFWLATSRKLPWHLMAFLNDASVNRGVLRQLGASYQFRHIELQRRLARR